MMKIGLLSLLLFLWPTAQAQVGRAPAVEPGLQKTLQTQERLTPHPSHYFHFAQTVRSPSGIEGRQLEQTRQRRLLSSSGQSPAPFGTNLRGPASSSSRGTGLGPSLVLLALLMFLPLMARYMAFEAYKTRQGRDEAEGRGAGQADVIPLFKQEKSSGPQADDNDEDSGSKAA